LAHILPGIVRRVGPFPAGRLWRWPQSQTSPGLGPTPATAPPDVISEQVGIARIGLQHLGLSSDHKPKPQPGGKSGRGFGVSTRGSVLAEGPSTNTNIHFWRSQVRPVVSLRLTSLSGSAPGPGSARRLGCWLDSADTAGIRLACGQEGSTLPSTRSGIADVANIIGARLEAIVQARPNDVAVEASIGL
jgi:hypothetical protein